MNLIRGMLLGIYTKLDAFLKNKSGQWILPIKLDNLSGKSNSNYDEEVVIANEYFVFNYFIDHQSLIPPAGQ